MGMLKFAYQSNGSSRCIHMGAWKRQSKDARDTNYALKLHGGLLARPASYDLRSICSPIEDQMELGSCTANMGAAMIESNEIKNAQLTLTAAVPTVAVSNVVVSAAGVVSFSTTVTPAAAPPPTPPPTPTPPLHKFVNVSRLFGYYATRLIEGSVGQDSGASIRDTLKAANKYGVADELQWPYTVSQFAVNPPAAVWTAAASHKVTSYHSIADGDLETMKTIISSGYLVGFGFDVYSAFMTSAMASSGLLCRPQSGEQLQGGHAVCLVGYDDKKVMPDGSVGAFLVRNSWGTNWGWQGTGYFWMSYGYVGDPKLASDFWVIQSSPI